MSKLKHTIVKDKVAKGNDKFSNKNKIISNTNVKVSKGKENITLPGAKGVHIGYTLGRLLKKLNMSTADLGHMLGISRQSARIMLKKKYLHAATMVKISEALRHDVVRYLYLPEDLPGSPALKERVEELEKENEGLKKEVVMLQKLVKLLEKKG